MIGITASTFDLLHAGHIKMLEYSSQYCDELWVAFQTGIHDRPEKNKPIQTVLERYIQIEAVKYVKKIIPYESEEDLFTLLLTIPQNHVRFVGEEYKDKNFTGKILYRSAMHPLLVPELIYTPRNHMWSTSLLRKQVYESESKKYI